MRHLFRIGNSTLHHTQCTRNFRKINSAKLNFNSGDRMEASKEDQKLGVDNTKDQKQPLEAYRKALLETIDTKEKFLFYNLERIKKYMIAEFQSKKEKALEDIDKIQNITDGRDIRPDILNATLPFTDFTRHLQDKLSNVLPTKQFFLNVTTDMINAVKMTEEETKVAKENFNIVCNYKKRREDNLSCEDLYNEALVKYLVAKTFKKSATDTYNLASCFPIDNYLTNNEILKVACIGGGPGSDLTGLINYLVECGYTNFECTIYDYNNKNWEKVCLAPLVDIIQKQGLKVFKTPIKILLKWEFVDMKKDWPDKEHIPKADVFSTCWALNECFFNTNFWEQLIEANPKSFFFFVDGETDPISKFQSLNCLKTREYIFEELENPRRLAIFPKKE